MLVSPFYCYLYNICFYSLIVRLRTTNGKSFYFFILVRKQLTFDILSHCSLGLDVLSNPCWIM